MTLFQELQVWARRAPTSERAFATIGLALALGLVAWLVVPASGPASSASGGIGKTATDQAGGTSSLSSVTTTTTATTTTASAPTLAGAAAGGSSTNGGPGVSGSKVGVNGSSAATGACASPPGTDQGVTSTQVNVAVILVSIAGAAANSTFGIPSAQQQQADFQAVFDSVNASGGVVCRKLVPTFYQLNPVDQSNLQQGCLTITQSHPFFVIDSGAYSPFPSLADCYMQAGDPFLEGVGISNAQRDQFYPYLFGMEDLDLLYYNTAYAWNQMGVFSPSNGFKKLGFIYRTCVPSLVSEYTSWLTQISGLSSSQIVSYSLGCPTAFASPSDLEQAVLTFKSDGVTNVTQIQDNEDMPQFTQIAQSQGFDPKYDWPDDAVVATSTGSPSDNYSNIDGAIAVTPLGYGEANTPGVAPLPGTAKCNAIDSTIGAGSVYSQPDGFGGAACNEVWMVAAAVDHTPALQRQDLASGLQAAGSVPFSYPAGPNSFSGPKTTTGGEYWRTVQFSASCSCWKVLNGGQWQGSFSGGPT
jgi:hypothetical protein